MAQGNKREREEWDHEPDDHVSKKDHLQEGVKYNLYIIKTKISAGHLNHLKTLSLKNGFIVSETYELVLWS